jgi:hypothetical protein
MKRKIIKLMVLVMLPIAFANGQTTSTGKDRDFDAHNTDIRYHFSDRDMDFNFGALVLGAAVNRGIEIGEAFYTASKIKDGDASSWQNEWFNMASLVEERGNKSLREGHTISARDQFLRASMYYRVSLISMLPDNPKLKERAKKCRELMKQAGKLMNPQLEYFEIPFENNVIPGYFRKAEAGDRKTKTLLMIGGGETFAEDLIFYIAQEAFDRGYNFMTIDLPGQGLMPYVNEFFRYDVEVPMKYVVDYAVRRDDVDTGKLVSYGISGGGGFVPRTAMYDKRIKAIAMSSAVVNAEELFKTMPVTKATPEDIDSWTSFHSNLVKAICWRWGVSKPSDLVEANKDFTFDPTKVTVPALLIIGEGEFKSEEVKRQQMLCMDNFPNPLKKMVITPSAEGATNHCIMENRSLMSQVLFDWFDDIIKNTQ